jgi:hypothetical protein
MNNGGTIMAFSTSPDVIAQAKQNASKTFASNQDARKWHSAHRHPDAIGWLCNAHGDVHLYSDGGFNNCSEPMQGGCDYFGEVVKEFRWVS